MSNVAADQSPGKERQSLPAPWEPGEAAWHPGYPFRPRLSAARRWGMLGLLLFLSLVIGAYLFITDSDRVRRLAQDYLTEVLGGPVRVGHVTLSIFEGLQIDDVEVRVDDTDRPDGVIFRARSFDIQYDFRAMLKGDLAATVIRAIDPHVRLTENTDKGTWNFQRMIERATSRPDSGDKHDLVLPEIVLRNARIDYSQICNGIMTPSGSFAIEGKLLPGSEKGKYYFDMQSRGPTDEMGPTLSGAIALNSGKVSAKLRNFTFGKDVHGMLPGIVRDWWDRHEFAGQIKALDLQWDGNSEGKSDKSFHVTTSVEGVTLKIHPEEWRSKEENGRISFARGLVQSFRTFEHGGAQDASTKNMTVDSLGDAFKQVPIVVDGISGDFAFTQDTIELKGITGRIETTPLKIHGRVDNYAEGGDAGFDMTVESGEDNIRIPHSPRWITSLPRPVRKIYDWFKPEGTAALTFHVARDKATVKDFDPDLRYSGRIEILQGDFQFIKFPYPARNAAGVIEFAQDPTKNLDYLDMNVHAFGLADGPNRDTVFTVKGHMSPLNSNVKINISIDGSNVTSEPALMAAYPGNVRKAVAFFDADGKGLFPKYHGKFHADLTRPYGEDTDWIINIDIDVDDAAGKLVAFPYPMEHVTGSAHIRKGYVDIADFKMKRGRAALKIGGRVSWEDTNDDDDDDHYDHNKVDKVKLTQDIHVTASGVPIDEDLRAALPGGKRAWLDKLGVGGTMDVEGKVFTPANLKPGDDDVTYDLKLTMRDGSIHPAGGDFTISGMAGTLRVSPTALVIEHVQGKRLDADVGASGKIEWPGDEPRAELHIDATALPLDAALYGTVPKSVRESWDAVKPVGTTDMKLDLRLGFESSTTRPSDHADVHLVLNPRKLSITPSVMPYRLDELQGTIEVKDENVTIPALAARHGKAGVKMAGHGTLVDKPVWDLAINAADIAIDDEFRKALPASVSSMAKSLELSGAIDVLCPKLTYRAGNGAKGDDNPDIDFATKIILKNAGMTAGVPMAEMNGQVDLTGDVRSGSVADLSGSVDIASLTISKRSAKNFHLDLAKTPGAPELRIDRMQSQLAGGEMAGQVSMMFPDKGPSKYALALVLRNADIKEMAGKFEENISGQMNASLSLEGDWNSDASRRGRGDVTVSGKNMVRIPLLLGLLQVTNLTLPTNNPFNEGEARYSVDGKRVTFETIQLRSADNLLRGAGWLDFGSKMVRMSFYTENPAIARMPVIGDIASGFKQELLQFQVRGTLEDPKVSASSFNTVTTTVDEVFKGDGARR